MDTLSSLAVMFSSIRHLQVSSSIWAQPSTPLSTTYCQDASGQPSGMSSLLPASGAVPGISHQDRQPRRWSSWQNATLWSWQRIQVPSSPVSHPSHTSPQPPVLDRYHEGSGQKTTSEGLDSVDWHPSKPQHSKEGHPVTCASCVALGRQDS